MPKPTFFNLPDDKRDHLIEVAIDEFGARPYRSASLSRIVQQARIAKGSIYQYFDDKLDLYTWLVTDELPRRKLAALGGATLPAEGDLFATLEDLCLAGLRFNRDNPKLAQLGAGLMDAATDPELGPLVSALEARGHAAMRAMLEAAQREGAVRGDVDLDVAATVLATLLGRGLLDVLLRRLGVDLRTFLSDQGATDAISDEELRGLVRSLVDVLRRGLGPAGKGGGR